MSLPIPQQQDPSAESLPGARRVWVNASFGVMGGAWLLVVLIHLSVSPGIRLMIWPLGYILLDVLATGSLLFRAWNSSSEERRAWWLLAASAFLEIPVLVLTFLVLEGFIPPWFQWLFHFAGLGTGALALDGILSFPKGTDQPGLGRRRGLDSIIFAASLLFMLWMIGVESVLHSVAPSVGLRVFVADMNVALIGGGLVYMTAHHPGRVRGPLGWLALSALAWLALLCCWSLAGLPEVLGTQWWVIVGGGIPFFLGLAAWSPLPVEAMQPSADPEQGLTWLLPYFPASLAIIVMGSLLAWAPAKVTREAFGLFLAIVTLLLLRVLQAIKDLRGARTLLEDRVRQRTKALEQAQDTLLKAERMNAVATMGAGLSHDLNNLLSVILNFAEMMRAEYEEGQTPSKRNLLRIINASEKAGQLTQRLMAFGRTSPWFEEACPQDLSRTLGSTREILRMLLPRCVQLGFRVDPLEAPVEVDASVLEQLLVNLVSNAKDAMPGGGEVDIWLHPGTLPGGNPAAVLEVRDTGAGIPLELQEAIFDPFFTTKPKGTGLGLASVRSLMETLGGTVEVESQPGRGTQFRLAFPIPQMVC